MQENIVCKDRVFYGKLKNVKDYSDFSNRPEEQNGHFLAMKIENEDPSSTIKFELVGGTGDNKKTIGEDGILVLRIQNKQTQSLRLTITGTDSGPEIVEYRFHGLTLE